MIEIQNYKGGYSGNRAVGKNMSNDDYLDMLEEQNKQKRIQEQNAKEERRKLEEREKGFNTYLGGAN